MTKSNVKIVRDYIEEVGNHKNYDALFEFVDKNFKNQVFWLESKRR